MKSPASKPRQPTLKMADLARIAGVSKSTVSRALSGSELINTETRERIQALAKKYNYRLNTQARNFRTKQTLTIAVVIPSAEDAVWHFSDPFFLELLGRISVSLIERDHQSLLSSLHLGATESIDMELSKIHCDGIIVMGQHLIHEQLNAFAAGGPTPMVVWGAQVEGQKYCTVGGDNLRGGRLATQHLLNQGCRDIAVMGDWRPPEGKLRFEGYRQTLANAGIEVNPALQLAIGTRKNEGYDAATRLIASGVRFDAIFAMSDTLAMSSINALDEQGLSVPGDVAVIGYDDISLTRFYTPSISSIQQDREIGGSLLVDKLLQLIDGQESTSFVLPTNLVVRKSSLRWANE